MNKNNESDNSKLKLLLRQFFGGPLPKGRPKGQQIDVTFKFDIDGIMFASFLDISSGKELPVKISDI